MNRSRCCRGDVASSGWQEFMKDVRNLRRGWTGGSASFSSQPVGSCSLTTIAWTGALFGRTPSHHLPTLGRLHLRGWSGRPSSSRSPRFGDRQSAALPDWSFCGVQRLGKTATLVPSRWSFARRHMLDTLADWWGLQRHCGGTGGRGLSAPQLTYPRSSWEQGSHLPYTPTGRLR